MPGNPNTASSNTTHAASRPATRQAIALAPAMVGRSHSIGQSATVSRSARGPSTSRRNSRKQTGDPGIKQPRPVRVETGGRTDARLMQVEPAVTGKEITHLDEPHGVVRIRERIGGLRPELGEQLERDQEPRKAQQSRKARLQRRAARHERNSLAPGCVQSEYPRPISDCLMLQLRTAGPGATDKPPINDRLSGCGRDRPHAT